MSAYLDGDIKVEGAQVTSEGRVIYSGTHKCLFGETHDNNNAAIKRDEETGEVFYICYSTKCKGKRHVFRTDSVDEPEQTRVQEAIDSDRVIIQHNKTQSNQYLQYELKEKHSGNIICVCSGLGTGKTHMI
jgi:hypothetical protein